VRTDSLFLHRVDVDIDAIRVLAPFHQATGLLGGSTTMLLMLPPQICATAARVKKIVVRYRGGRPSLSGPQFGQYKLGYILHEGISFQVRSIERSS
jgi:hypothetical protein